MGTFSKPKIQHDITIHGDNTVSIGCKGPFSLETWEKEGVNMGRVNHVGVAEQERAFALLDRVSNYVRGHRFHPKPETQVYKWRVRTSANEEYETEYCPEFFDNGLVNLNTCGRHRLDRDGERTRDLTRCKIERIAE